eukprot:GHVS01096980.1.p1 GENE.GHVS01096980.1~~GHVS01096980.1.p1  ORF type:complete len:369 (+),score=66.68 GHVS01096980.1:152-1258(+)
MTTSANPATTPANQHDSPPPPPPVPKLKLRGSVVALVTPMTASPVNEIDIPRVNELVDWHAKSGTHGLVVVGTTGESPTVSLYESGKIVQACVTAADGRIPIVVGTGTNCTSTTIDKTRMAFINGAAAALVVTPYYNKPTQEGLFQHFSAVADAVKALPIILYNIPSRASVDLLPGTVKRLFEAHANIVGIKEASGTLDRILQLRESCGSKFLIYSGDDGNCVRDMLDGGADGVMSVTANICPCQMAALCEAALEKQKDEALSMDANLQPLHEALFVEPNPTGPKFVLRDMGKIEGGIRLPLLPLSTEKEEAVRLAYKNAVAREGSVKKAKSVETGTCGGAAKTQSGSAVVGSTNDVTDHFDVINCSN